ncbi:MAG TPA: ABC transporter permease, partial [Vicinamibacterales bacterium]|nr:ABC transporter permease [Vicinamibacterales bacterium]
TLRRDLALTTFAVTIIGLGVGATATIFNVVNAVWLRPLPFHDPERLVWIANGTDANLSAQTVQVMNLQELEAQSASFDGVAAFSPFYGVGDNQLTGSGDPERVTGIPVTADFFPLLGVTPRLGRTFSDAEAQWGAPKAVILGDAFWRRRFAADPGVVGRVITIDGAPATVVGVLPRHFDFAGIFAPGSRADYFVPFPLGEQTNRTGNSLALIGRLQANATIESAQAEATLVGDRIKAGSVNDKLWRNAFRPVITPLRERISGQFRTALLALSAAVSVLMLLVSANLSNLLLARASGRQRDLAVRAALGAERWQLVRQMLIESLTLAGAGALAGAALAATATTFLARLDRTTIPLLYDARVDGLALGAIAFVAIATGLAVGVLPAIQASRQTPRHILSEASRGSVGVSRSWMQRAVVIAEVAVVCVLLAGAGLLARSLIRVLDADLGFASENLLTVRVDPRRASTTRASRNVYFDDVLREVAAVPGVDAIGLTDALPFGENFGWREWGVTLPGQSGPNRKRANALVRMIDDRYLTTMRIGLRSGRAFTAADLDSTEPVAIVNETLARMLWLDADPLGQLLYTAGRERRVVGVVGGVKYFGLDRDSGPEMYMPLRQTGDYHVVDLVIRSAASADRLIPAVRAALRRVDPNLPLTEFHTMSELVDRAVFARRFVVQLIAAFALFGLVLASLGLYAVIAYSVSQRRQEIGLRMALGASPHLLRRRVMTETFRLALAGVVIGLPIAWMATRTLRSLLFGVEPTDPLTFAGVLTIVIAVVGVAGYFPARQASRIDPVIALRS